jgi:hypothetical protein
MSFGHSLLSIYDRLAQKHRQQGAILYDLVTETAKTTSILKRLENTPSGFAIRKIIYLLALHHATITEGRQPPNIIPYRGRPITKDKGAIFILKDFPPLLIQYIFIFMREIADGTCPELSK